MPTGAGGGHDRTPTCDLPAPAEAAQAAGAGAAQAAAAAAAAAVEAAADAVLSATYPVLFPDFPEVSSSEEEEEDEDEDDAPASAPVPIAEDWHLAAQALNQSDLPAPTAVHWQVNLPCPGPAPRRRHTRVPRLTDAAPSPAPQPSGPWPTSPPCANLTAPASPPDRRAVTLTTAHEPELERPRIAELDLHHRYRWPDGQPVQVRSDLPWPREPNARSGE